MEPHSFPVDEWRIIEDHFDSSEVPAHETIYTLGNGYMGIRGSFPERRCVYKPGTFLNGFYESEPIIYGEHAYGFAKHRQHMLNVTDPTGIELWVDDDVFDLSTGEIEGYRRTLDLRTGCLEREVTWTSPSGKTVFLRTRRIVSFLREHLALFTWECVPVGTAAYFTIVSGLRGQAPAESGAAAASDDPRVGGLLTGDPLVLRKKRIGERTGTLRHITRNTKSSVVCSMTNDLRTENRCTQWPESTLTHVSHRYQVYAEPDVPVALNKYVVYFHSYDAESKRISGLAERELTRAEEEGPEALIAEQRFYLDEFWHNSDIRIEEHPMLQQSLRFNLFHVLQATGRNGRTNIGAKGLTGEGYEGHYFWDTEIYALPFYTYTTPFIARRLLQYRYNTLPQARERARELRHRGALYPWRTINGEEASAYFPAGTAQYHINADIVFAMRKYVEATGDLVFLHRQGAEMLFEVARFWLDLGCYVEGKGFCINMVTGPNEYTVLVSNNLFTNLMVQDNLFYAARVARRMRSNHPDAFAAVAQKIGLSDREIDDWEQAASRLYVPYDPGRGLYPQDDSFFDKDFWDFKNTEPYKYPLLLQYHPLSIYRYQVCKQPDVVLALLLQGWRFSMEEKRHNFDYYDALNTGDSSLSSCVQSIVAAEVGYIERAYEYFMKTARMDLDDINGNVKDGIHAANMAGCWMSLVFGFGGMRDYHGVISFNPRLPSRWRRLAFNVRVHDSLISVDLTHHGVTYTLLEGGVRRIVHETEEIELQPSEPVFRTVDLPGRAAQKAAARAAAREPLPEVARHGQ